MSDKEDLAIAQSALLFWVRVIPDVAILGTADLVSNLKQSSSSAALFLIQRVFAVVLAAQFIDRITVTPAK